ncbi:MAG: immunoglobulin domain-containing protein [Bacteroidetes bacterium]|nr:immunoglobulin domain-containing protein [Bacteroidota bacterium]
MSSWLSLSTYSDTISSGASQQIDAQFNAKDLNAGVYNAEILINSNNPVNSSDTIACVFTVQGSPAIVLSATSIDFGDVFVNATSTDTLFISNTGCDTLKVNNITSSTSEFTVDTTTFDIMPGGIAEVVVSFTPTTLGSFNGILTVYNNDADATQVVVAVTGTGIASGTSIITLSVSNLDFGDVETGTTAEQNYTVSGTNLTDDITLNAPTGFEISLTSGSGFASSLILTQTGGTVSTTTIYVRFAPTLEQPYSDNITHTSTDATQVDVAVTGNGICDNLIVTGPGNQTKCEGETATFTVSVTGTETITYVWKKGIVILSNGGDISGATTNSISIANIESSDAGTYTCEVTDACGNTVISTEGILTVPSVVNITINPVSLTKCEGEQAQFTVSATGDGLFYQWQKDGTDISGATTDTCTINSVSTSDAGEYTCIVSDDCGSVTSDSATLAVKLSTEITQQPDDINANEGEDISLNIVATGTNLTYQWRFEGVNIEGADIATYQILSVVVDNAGNYDVVVTGECGEFTSDIAVLSVATNVEKLSENDINIYPNPSKGIFNISYNKNIETVEVIIINFEGKVIYQKNYNSGNFVIDLSDKAKGVYLIKFNYAGKSLVSRIVLE